MAKCVVCGKKLTGRQTKFCSPEHKTEWHNAQKKAEARKVRCAVTIGGETKVLCYSGECGRQDCNRGWFETVSGTAKHCSDRCRNRAWRMTQPKLGD